MSADYKGVTLYDVKKFLKFRGLNYEESHACLALPLPCYCLGQQLTTEWNKLPENVTTVFINKVGSRSVAGLSGWLTVQLQVTGRFVCPELAAHGSWSELESLLAGWVENKKKPSQARSLPSLSRLDLSLSPAASKVVPVTASHPTGDMSYFLWTENQSLWRLLAVLSAGLLPGLSRV